MRPLVFGAAGGLFLAQAQSPEAVECRRDIDEAWAGKASWQGVRPELYDSVQTFRVQRALKACQKITQGTCPIRVGIKQPAKHPRNRLGLSGVHNLLDIAQVKVDLVDGD